MCDVRPPAYFPALRVSEDANKQWGVSGQRPRHSAHSLNSQIIREGLAKD